MMNLILFWQRVHYNVYKFNCFSQIYVGGLPVTLLLKLKAIKALYKKKGIDDPNAFLDKILTNPKVSTVNKLTDGGMMLLTGLFLYSIPNFISAICGRIIWIDWDKLTYLSIMLPPNILFNYHALWKGDKYLAYYKKFDKEPKAVKRKWAWITFATAVGLVLLVICSFWAMTEGIH